MRRSSLEALENVDQRKRPAIFIAKRPEQNVHMVRHDNDRVQVNSRFIDGECGAGALARERQMPPSRRQCLSIKSRASAGKTFRPPVQNVTNKSASVFCTCGSRLRYDTLREC